MNRKFAVLTLLTFSAAVAFGASPVATVSSTGSFELHGATVKTEGIPTWPVLGGDEIRTGLSQARIQFVDGSMVLLNEQSVGRVEQSGDALQFRLLSGSMQIVAARESAVRYFNNAQPVETKSGSPVRVSAGTVKTGRPGGITPSVIKPPPVSGK